MKCVCLDYDDRHIPGCPDHPFDNRFRERDEIRDKIYELETALELLRDRLAELEDMQ